MDKSVLYGLSYGMYVVGASDAGRPVGCIINTCIQITSDEPVLAVSLNKNNYTLSAVKRTRRFGLSVIAERTDRSIIPIFGFQCSRDCDKYAAYSYDSLRGVPLVKGCFAGRLVCEVLHMVDCGTHEVVFARLLDTLPGEPDAHPMTYEYYHKVVKGRAPKNAPTYRAEEDSVVPEESSPASVAKAQPAVAAPVAPPAAAPKDAPVSQAGKADYVCPVCGYLHRGDMSGEAPDYVCPVCGMPGSAFEPKEE